MSVKDSGLRVRVDKALRHDFLEACHAQDRPAAQVIREFMRKYVARTDGKSKNAD
ncbi:plasmid-related protein [Sphingomonas sp. YR710]|uniref:plasmid-related protein n=1 Tax=Sphingomonas sp. YR710 TaxID=1882773 RepID=UPI003526B2D1